MATDILAWPAYLPACLPVCLPPVQPSTGLTDLTDLADLAGPLYVVLEERDCGYRGAEVWSSQFNSIQFSSVSAAVQSGVRVRASRDVETLSTSTSVVVMVMIIITVMVIMPSVVVV